MCDLDHDKLAHTTELKVCPYCKADLNFIRATSAMPANIVDTLEELDDPLGQGEPDEDDEITAVVLPDLPRFTIPSGKYKGITFTRMIGIKPSYYEQVIALKDEIAADPEFQQHASSIAYTYAELRREAAVKAKELSNIKLRMTAAMLLMIDQFEVERETGLTLATGDKVRWQPEPHLVVKDKEAFRVWCNDQGLQRDMVLPWGKANKLMKDMLIAGEPLPDSGEMFMRPKVVFTPGVK